MFQVVKNYFLFSVSNHCSCFKTPKHHGNLFGNKIWMKGKKFKRLGPLSPVGYSPWVAVSWIGLSDVAQHTGKPLALNQGLAVGADCYRRYCFASSIVIRDSSLTSYMSETEQADFVSCFL